MIIYNVGDRGTREKSNKYQTQSQFEHNSSKGFEVRAPPSTKKCNVDNKKKREKTGTQKLTKKNILFLQSIGLQLKKEISNKKIKHVQRIGYKK